MEGSCSSEDVRRRREEIDQLDAELVRLLNERAQLALHLAQLKTGLGLNIHDPQREQQVLERVAGTNSGPFDQHGLRRIFRRIIVESRRIEQRRCDGGSR